MKMQAYIDEIKMELTGGVLDLEIDDTLLQKVVNASLREVQRYICSTKVITIPYEKCIDLTKYKVNSVTNVFRATGIGVGDSNNQQESTVDPVQVGLWQLTSNYGNLYNFNDYLSRFGAWSTIEQIQNTLSTDLAYYYQDAEHKLYINTTLSAGSYITIEYVPRYDNVEDVTSDFWIDVIMRMAKAKSKIIIGTIRKKYTQSNALWQLDTDILTRGEEEYTNLQNYLQSNSQLFFPMD